MSLLDLTLVLVFEPNNHQASKLDQVLHFRVGTSDFATTLRTILNRPNSTLGRMFGGQFQWPSFIHNDQTKQHYYFIDRDGKMFSYILEYLRDLNVVLPSAPYSHRMDPTFCLRLV